MSAQTMPIAAPSVETHWWTRANATSREQVNPGFGVCAVTNHLPSVSLGGLANHIVTTLFARLYTSSAVTAVHAYDRRSLCTVDNCTIRALR